MEKKVIENVISIKYDHFSKRLTLIAIRPIDGDQDRMEEHEFEGIRYITNPFSATFKVNKIQLDFVLDNVIEFSEPVKVTIGNDYAHIEG